MKSFKLIFINALTLIIGLGLLSGSVSNRNAEAARFELIPPVKVTKLGNFRGQYLTVLYAVGSKPFISTSKSQITLSQIKESRTLYLDSDSVELPKVQVEKEGFRPSYNMILFIVSSQPNYTWKNADGSTPQGGAQSANNSESAIETISKTEVDNFITANGIDASFIVPMLK